MRDTFVCPTIGFSRSVVAALIVLLVVGSGARATDFFWDGGAGDNVWDTVILNPGVTTNWSPENVPISTDNIFLTAASAAGPVTIDVDGSREVGRIEHNGASGNYTFGETVGADTITIFQGSPGSVLVNQTQGRDLTFNSNFLLNQGGGSVLRFNSTNAADNSGHIVVNGSVSPSAATTDTITLSLTSTNKSAGPWVIVNGVISDGPGATIGLTAGVETAQSEAVTADHAGEVSVTGLNTFTGSVRITGGRLIFNSIENIGSADPNALGMPTAGNATIVMGDLNIASGTLKYVGGSTASNTSNRPIQIVDSNTTATIDASGTVPLVLSGGITAPTSSTTTRTLNLAGSNTGDNTISGVIEPAAGTGVLNVNKTGLGKWILTAANTYDGATSVQQGELVLQGAGARIGDPNGAVGALNISSGATFTLDGGAVEALDLNNSGTLNFRSGQLTLRNNNTTTGAGSFTIGTDGAGTLRLDAGSQVFGNITLQGSDDDLIITASGTFAFTSLDNSAGGDFSSINANLQMNGGQITTTHGEIRSRIIGTGGLTKVGPGTLILSHTGVASDHTGPTIISGGILRPVSNQTADQMSDLSPVTIAAGATLDLTQSNDGEEIGALSGAGTVLTEQFEDLAVDTGGASATFSGNIMGGGAFFKRGTGTQTLAGENTYTGATSVDGSGGTLEIVPGGSITGTSDVTYSTNATLSVAGGTIDTPARIRPIANSAVLNITAGLVKANQIDRTVNSQYLSPFNWTGGTVHLLSAATINGSTTTAADRPFAGALTLDGDMTLIVDATFSVTGGSFNINGGSVTADTIVTGGNISFNSGSMRMRNDQTFSAARLAALDVATPLGATRSLIVDGAATIDAPLTLAGGSFSTGQVINPQNLILSSGALNITNSDLAIDAATSVDVSSGMTVNVTNGALNNAGDLNVIGGTASFAAASTNQAGAEINAISATLAFTGGLTNNGELNLINSTFQGDLINAAGSNSSLLGSNSFSDDLVLAGGDRLLVDIGGNQAGDFDVVTVGDDATLNGLLVVSLTGGFSPSVGQQFTVLTADSIVDNGLTLAGSAAGSFSMLVGSTSVILQAIAPGLAGDFNNDGKVDAADYVVWRKTDGTQAGYNTWRANFGRTTGGGAVAEFRRNSDMANSEKLPDAVPEPTTALILCCATMLAVWRARVRHNDVLWNSV